MGTLDEYADATSGSIMRMAARVLGAGDALDELAREAGIAVALAGLLRAIPFHAARRKLFLPADLMSTQSLSPEEIFAGQGGDKLKKVKIGIASHARQHLVAARRIAVPQDALAAFLPSALVPLYLRRTLHDKADPPLYRRQIALLRAALTGRI
jgi:phytoene synthase